ncbi:hypothetical protein [Crocosphaera sp. XPORK-15E]|uniref:hypothetical protein n=1 Tax=Crocosphaera sp. XPORK-15E TaxID=3110247 RepID=UPI002B220EE7|nr:hypothetical protein [Crocosphaera sp. XPORK-15E]MEA5535170.1 hypothetical protein [Crocosphaera sp. XPORK-15E]
MNEPTTVTYSLEEMFSRLENKIDSNQKETNEKFKEMHNKLETIQKDITQKIDKQSEEITTIKATLQAQQPLIQKIPDLAEKVGELKNWRQIVFIALTTVAGGVMGWFIRGGTLKP